MLATTSCPVADSEFASFATSAATGAVGNFGYGCAHFVDGGCDLGGTVFLRLAIAESLFGFMRQLIGGCCQLTRVVSDLDQRAMDLADKVIEAAGDAR